jgi:hypothetical protein
MNFRAVAFAVLALVCVLAPPAWSDTMVEGLGDTAAHHEHGARAVSPLGQTPEEELAYSLFMHHSSGIAVLMIGALLLMDRLTGRRWPSFGIGMGLVWLLFGIHIFVRSDLEGWPVGPAGFLESFSMPTAGEWIQHKALSLIPLGLGVFYLVRPPKPGHEKRPYGSYLLAGLAGLGAIGLLIHQHQDHPGMDLVNIQHRLMAVSSLFIAASAVLEARMWPQWRIKPYLLPVGLLAIGLQLTLYVE